jgi:outer membrane lipoprotein
MKRLPPLMILIPFVIAVSGCAVISRSVMKDALTDVSFSQLRAAPDRYRGQTVVLGGHIIAVRNEARQTVLVVLQSPLGFRQEPQPPDKSEGRFLLKTDGFLDPEVYAKGRALTVAGRVEGQTRENIDDVPYDYLVLEAREIHLWEREEDLYRNRPIYPPPIYDPWYGGYWRRGYRYR